MDIGEGMEIYPTPQTLENPAPQKVPFINPP